MRKICLGIALLGAFTAGYLLSQQQSPTHAGDKKSTASGQIGHMVYFKLKDNSPAEKKKLVDACKKYLTKHEGEVYFAAGTLAEKLKREVNVTDWDVALHIVFRDMKSHDLYQDAKRHQQFIDENKSNWANVRVFDSVLE
jgi:hypothetical protein